MMMMMTVQCWWRLLLSQALRNSIQNSRPVGCNPEDLSSGDEYGIDPEVLEDGHVVPYSMDGFPESLLADDSGLVEIPAETRGLYALTQSTQPAFRLFGDQIKRGICANVDDGDPVHVSPHGG